MNPWPDWIRRQRTWRWTARLLLAAAAGWSIGAVGAEPTDVNRANQAELEMVRGVGPQLSERLLAERRLAPFADWDDLIRRMRGIGPARAERLSAAGLRVQGQALPASAPAVPLQSAQPNR